MSQSVELGDVLEEKGIYVGTVNGTSMFPMLRNKKDTVIIRPLTGKLKKYDITLYRKRKTAEKYLCSCQRNLFFETE